MSCEAQEAESPCHLSVLLTVVGIKLVNYLGLANFRRRVVLGIFRALAMRRHP